MISSFRVKNYKALRDVELALTPMHVLIGQNDTGKTSILEALAALSRSADHYLNGCFPGRWKGDELLWHGPDGSAKELTLEASFKKSGIDYSLVCAFDPDPHRNVMRMRESFSGSQYHEPDKKALFSRLCEGSATSTLVCRRRHKKLPAEFSEMLPAEFSEMLNAVLDELSGVAVHRWWPQHLAIPNARWPHEPFTLEASGFGLAHCLEDILGEDRQRWDAIERRFCQFFPEMSKIKLKPEPGYLIANKDSGDSPEFKQGHGKGIWFLTKRGFEISASQVSDGMLLVLAYLAIVESPNPPRVLLVEEPENGIHPKRLKEVVSMLRELIDKQDRTQVLMTTHSPYVLDLFKPEEVTLCRKDKDGAVSVQRLSDSKVVLEQNSVFTLGEIWTGEGDEALATPAASPAEEKAS